MNDGLISSIFFSFVYDKLHILRKKRNYVFLLDLQFNKLSLALFSSSKLLREKEKQITLCVPFVGHKIGSTLALHIHFAFILILENYVSKNGLHYRIKE